MANQAGRTPIAVQLDGFDDSGGGVRSSTEDVVLKTVEDLEAMVGCGELENKVVLGGGGGLEFDADLVKEPGEEGVVERRGREVLGAKAVTASVLGGASFAGGGAGSGGAEGAGG